MTFLSKIKSYLSCDNTARITACLDVLKQRAKDIRYLNLAKEISGWSKDPSTKVGAVIVGDKDQIISQGYNGFPRGFNDSDDIYNNKPLKYKYVIHAEANAIYNALYNGAFVEDACIYVHGLPVCCECAKAIVQSGITRVVYDSEPKEKWVQSCSDAMDIFEQAGVEVVKISC